MLISSDTEFGKRVNQRLQDEKIIWLTTVDKNGIPQTRPVWFYWNNESFLVYSRPGAAKLKHTSSNPGVGLNFDGDGKGGDIIVFIGKVERIKDEIPSEERQAYCEKYKEGFKRIGMTADQFGEVYSEAIRIKPERVRGH
ncbi:MAG: TIGR03667 family PPOX class F420-dependent oxidoreductase [Anaerolineae bacterium]|nr:MAG: TIGR03667 family PPOX class F420-dependent oxidoreductase [Anaerolineae bacterium]